jgi:hypothetical protein
MNRTNLAGGEVFVEVPSAMHRKPIQEVAMSINRKMLLSMRVLFGITRQSKPVCRFQANLILLANSRGC